MRRSDDDPRSGSRPRIPRVGGPSQTVIGCGEHVTWIVWMNLKMSDRRAAGALYNETLLER